MGLNQQVCCTVDPETGSISSLDLRGNGHQYCSKRNINWKQAHGLMSRGGKTHDRTSIVFKEDESKLFPIIAKCSYDRYKYMGKKAEGQN